MACDEISFFSSWSWHGIIVGLFQSGAPNWRRERKSRPILSRAYLWDKMNGYALVVRLGMMCDIHITSNCSSGQYRSVAEVTFMWWWCGNFVYLFVLYSFRFFFFLSSFLLHQAVIIDGRGHLVGRLASVVAKNLLQGGKIVVTRCEELTLSGHFYRFVIYWFCMPTKTSFGRPISNPLFTNHSHSLTQIETKSSTWLTCANVATSIQPVVHTISVPHAEFSTRPFVVSFE